MSPGGFAFQTGGGKQKHPSRFLQPMLKDLDVDHIRVRPAVVGPDFLLLEPYAIERLRRQPAPHLRQLFGIGKGAAKALDLADVAANVERRADVAEWRRLAYAHPL